MNRDARVPGPANNDPDYVGSHGLVCRFLAPNPSAFTLQGTNTYVLGRHHAIVIDPGPDDPTHIARLTGWLQRSGIVTTAILLTHHHEDHAGGAVAAARAWDAPIWTSENHHDYSAWGVATRLFGPDTSLYADGFELHVVETPGHTRDSVCFLFARAGVLVTGDTVLGYGSTVVSPPDGNMSDYMSSLRGLLRMDATFLAPGHGPPSSTPENRIQECIDHRMFREEQVYTGVKEGLDHIDLLVSTLYSETPDDLHALAAGSVRSQLEKLEREGRVRRIGGRWTTT